MILYPGEPCSSPSFLDMERELKHLKDFLIERRQVLNWRGIEIVAQVPKGVIKEFVLYDNGWIEKHLDKLLPVLAQVGYERLILIA